jgi:hypothetical protein
VIKESFYGETKYHFVTSQGFASESKDYCDKEEYFFERIALRLLNQNNKR